MYALNLASLHILLCPAWQAFFFFNYNKQRKEELGWNVNLVVKWAFEQLQLIWDVKEMQKDLNTGLSKIEISVILYFKRLN